MALLPILLKARDGLARQFWREYFTPDDTFVPETSAAIPGTVLVDTSGNAINPASAEVIQALIDALTPANLRAVQVTQTKVTGTGGLLIAANANRLGLRWMVVGDVDVTVAPGVVAPNPGVGFVYSANGAAKQGASESFPEKLVPTNAFGYVAAATTTIIVWEFIAS